MHVETDTRTISHITLPAKKKNYIRCTVDCKDTYVFLLLAYYRHILTPEIWMRICTKQNRYFITVHDLQMTKCLPVFHNLTGCDATSQFTGLGKFRKYFSSIIRLMFFGMGNGNN